jgi:hypothetical protein
VLEKLCRAKSTSQQLAARCHIILLSAQGMRNQHQAEALGLQRLMVGRWRRRWAAQSSRLEAAEKGTDKELQAVIVALLSDAPRSGAPSKFTPEQVAALIALGCEPTADSGLPVELSLNRSKGARGPDQWLPPAGQCGYVARFVRIMKQYGLTSSVQETNWMQSHLDDCRS